MIAELKPDMLRKRFDPEDLGIKSTKKISELNGIIGQKRAVNALKFGLQIDGSGYNIFVAGPPGIGKMTSIKTFLKEFAKSKDIPPDWCYVNNFNDPYEPKVIQLPAGKGCEFMNDMEDIIHYIQRDLPKAFDSDEYSSRRERILKKLNQEQEQISNEINNRAAEKGFMLQPTPMGLVIVPLKDGQPLKEEEFQQLPETERKEVQEKREQLEKEMKTTMKQIRRNERNIQERVKKLDRQVALNIVGGLIDDLIEKYQEFPKVVNYLKEVQEDILENIDVFKKSDEEKMPEIPGMQQMINQMQQAREAMRKKYRVNVVVDNSKRKGAPVIEELNPTFQNLVGRIEKEMQMGALNTDFTMIKAGSLLRANGGFLVMTIEDILKNVLSWDGLKRTLRSNEVQIEELGERLGFMTVKTLRPQPIPLNVKVVLVGSPIFYQLLQTYDPDFPELFKVKADFDTRMPINSENMKDFLSFVSTYCNKEHLKHLNAGAISRLLEYGLRLAEDQERISTKFGNLADIIRESNYWAGEESSEEIQGKHVKKAIDEKNYRSSLIEERIREMIERETILIDTRDQVVGQVNGLSVMDLGDYAFGKPSRITATVAPGRDGIIDIEREVKLGGPIHSKGVLILSGYIAGKYTRGRPLSLAARLVFEQSYSGVEGDSASSAELYALLSALSGVPLKQGIAVTGSVNQQGGTQAVGGINFKIEGFYDVCKVKGLTGEQGVIIPHSNQKNLMLREDVVEAVQQNKFHIWAVKTIDEGIKILTGVPAGTRREDGVYPKDSINHRVQNRLIEFEDIMQRNGRNN